MATEFDSLLTALDAAVASATGEAASLTPRLTAPYGAPATDPSRPVATITGIFSDGPGSAYLNGGPVGDFSGKMMMDALVAEFWLPAAGVAGIGYEIRTGDGLILTGRTGTPTYRVVEIQRTNGGDANLVLTLEPA